MPLSDGQQKQMPRDERPVRLGLGGDPLVLPPFPADNQAAQGEALPLAASAQLSRSTLPRPAMSVANSLGSSSHSISSINVSDVLEALPVLPATKTSENFTPRTNRATLDLSLQAYTNDRIEVLPRLPQFAASKVNRLPKIPQMDLDRGDVLPQLPAAPITAAILAQAAPVVTPAALIPKALASMPVAAPEMMPASVAQLASAISQLIDEVQPPTVLSPPPSVIEDASVPTPSTNALTSPVGAAGAAVADILRYYDDVAYARLMLAMTDVAEFRCLARLRAMAIAKGLV